MLLHSTAGAVTPKYRVVNNDADVTNIREVAWAFATRNAPGETGETIWKDETNQPLVPYAKPGEESSMRGTKVIYACLPPDEWGTDIPATRASFKHNDVPELQERVVTRWKEYGFADAHPQPVEGALERPLCRPACGEGA